jgi:Lon-like ATP-dependent protease
VIVPKENWQEMFGELQGMEIIAVETIEEVLEHALGLQFGQKPGFVPAPQEIMIAEQIGVLHTHLIK